MSESETSVIWRRADALAFRSGRAHATTGDLLAELCRRDYPDTHTLLRNAGVNEVHVTAAVDTIARENPDLEPTKKAAAHAVGKATMEAWDFRIVHARHLLHAVLDAESGVAPQVLTRLRVDVEALRAKVAQSILERDEIEQAELDASLVTRPAPTPNPLDVAAAVDAKFDDYSAASEKLRAWGDAALAILEARLGGSPRGDWSTVCAIRDLDTQAAISSLVAALSREPDLRQSALSALWMCTHQISRHRLRLRNDARFKQAIERILENGSFVERGTAAAIVASLRWIDLAPLLERRLADENLNVREAAAKALRELTGRVVTVSRPGARFPSERPEEDLFGLPRSMGTGPFLFENGRGSVPRIGFAVLPDGRSCLSTTEGSRLRLHAADDAIAHVFEAPDLVQEVLTLRSQGAPSAWVIAVSNSAVGHAQEAFAVDAQSRVLWSYQPRGERGFKAMAVLHGPSDSSGVAFAPGGAEGVVAVGPDGAPLWTLPERHVVYELASHPALAGRLLVVGGDLELVDAEGRTLAGRTPSEPSESRPYVHHAILFPNEHGAAAVVATGSGPQSVPHVVGYDEGLNPLWTATLPGGVAGLVMLEPTQSRRIFLAALRTGDLVAFDQDGKLRWRDRLPDFDKEENHVLDVRAGRRACGSWTAVVQTARGTWLVDLKA